VNSDGNRKVPYLNENSGKRKLNLNWDNPGNQWDPDNRFLAVRNFLLACKLSPMWEFAF